MFKELINAFRSKSALDEMLAEFDQMLSGVQWMFGEACNALSLRLSPSAVGQTIYDRDRQINELERSIRSRIVNHLLINPGQQVVASLAMMSVVKDAERIGDYCKNVLEVARFYHKALTAEPYMSRLAEVQRQIEGLFDATRLAYLKSDEDRARYVIGQLGSIRQTCDSIVEELLKQQDRMPVDEAVAMGLLARHFKRVAAHLGNICTAVVSPVDRLDFRPDSGGEDDRPA